MNKDNLIIFLSSFFSSFVFSLMLYSIREFGFSIEYYGYILTIININILLSSLFFGNIKIDKKNYLFYCFLGIISILVAIFLFLYSENIYYFILSIFFLFFLGSSTTFAMIKEKKDIGLYFYFTLFGTFGYFLSQILIFLEINLKIILIFSFISFLIISLISLFFYFKRILHSIYLYIKENYGILGTLESMFIQIEEKKEISFKFIGKPSVLSIFNFLVSIGFAFFWTSLVTLSDKYNNFFPLFLFLNSSFLILSYKLLLKIKSRKTSRIFLGIFLRLFGSILLLYFFIIKTVENIFSLIFFYILAAISWGIFSFYMDDYILNKKIEEFGYISFFRNLGAIVGSFIVGIFGIKFSLLFSIFILSLAISLIFTFK